MNNTAKKTQIPAFFRSNEFVTVVILIAMVIVVSAFQGNFFSATSINNNIISWTPLILLTMGQAIVIIAGGLDMSSGNAMSFMMCAMAATMHADDPSSGIPALILCIILALMTGLVNGLAVAYFKLPPIIATFATSYIWLGAGLFFIPTPGGECVNWMRVFYRFSSVEGMPEPLAAFGSVVPTGVLMIVAAIVIWAIVRKTKTGRYIYAVGSNRNVAYDSGINTVKIQITAYLINSLFIMFAALFMIGQNQAASARIGDPLTLQCIAAAIVGGVLLTGGRGNVFMTIAGAVIMSLVTSLIYFMGVSGEWQTFLSGLILLIAIASSKIIEGVKSIGKKKKEVTANE
jgi:ribose transport system permease protein